MTDERIAPRSTAWPVRAALFAAAFLVLTAAAPANAHPLSQGALDVTVYPDKVMVRARVTVEEMTITCFLRWRSTRVPKNVPNAAVKSM